MGDTKIQWCEKSWNVIAGCTKISPGCKNCYAERQSQRLANMGQEHYGQVVDNWQWNGKVAFNEKKLREPTKWKKPRLIFVNSMSDTFHEDVPIIWVNKIIYSCRQAPQHDYLFLTKRINKLIDYSYISKSRFLSERAWLGVSICTQRAADRDIPKLLLLDAKVRFISVEPMLERIDIPPRILSKLSWVIIGCESRPGRRIVPNKYLLQLAHQCKRLKVPVFLKQINRNRELDGPGNPIIKTPIWEMMEYPDGN